MNEREFRELSASHALHALEPEEERSFQLALAQHPEWQEIVDSDLAAASELGAHTPVAPPASIRAALLNAITDIPQNGEADPAVEPAVLRRDEVTSVGSAADASDVRATLAPAPRKSRRRAGWFALAASVALLIGVALVPMLRSVLAPQDPVTLAMAQIEAAPDAERMTAEAAGGGWGTLHWSSSLEQGVFVADGFPLPGEDHDFEVWILRDEQPISIGVMGLNDSGDGEMIPEGLSAGDALAITVEDRGGSTDGLPTTDAILVVPVV